MAQLNHIGVILDGNRRFARANNIEYDEVYNIAAERVTNLVQWILIENRAKILSVYALSLDNVRKRLPQELEPIYRVQTRTYNRWRKSNIMLDNGIKVIFAGERKFLPKNYKRAMLDLEEQTKHCDRRKFYILAAYSGKLEICKATDLFRIREPINYNNVEYNLMKFLYVKEAVDLVIRTAGEQRLSDFLPYQSSYAEFIFLDKFFPAITKEDIEKAIEEFSNRKRKFGE